MVSTGGRLTVDGTGWEVWLQVVVMSRGRRRPCYLGEMDGRFLQRTRPPMFEIRAAIGDGGTLIADVQDPQRGASQASPRMAGQIAKPLTGCVALVHLQDAIPAVSRLLAGSSGAPNALGCSSPRGNTCSIPAPLTLCMCLGVRYSAAQCGAMRCYAMLCGVIGMRAGRCVAGQVLVFSGVAQCLKQSLSRGLVVRMATSWGSFVVVAISQVRLVDLSCFVRVNPSIRQHRVEKHSRSERPQAGLAN